MRGVTITVNPPNTPDAGLPAEQVPFLVRAKGAEVGWRARPVSGLETSVALFVLDYDSELLFVGDAGNTEASRPSRRTGVEWTTFYKPVPWLAFELDIAATRARFADFDPAGNRIPGAPNVVSSFGVTFGQQLGWFGAVKVRYFGPRPLIEDDSVRSDSTTLVNARLGYRFENGMQLQLDAFNLFNVKAPQITYFYRIPTTPARRGRWCRRSASPSGRAIVDQADAGGTIVGFIGHASPGGAVGSQLNGSPPNPFKDKTFRKFSRICYCKLVADRLCRRWVNCLPLTSSLCRIDP